MLYHLQPSVAPLQQLGLCAIAALELCRAGMVGNAVPAVLVVDTA